MAANPSNPTTVTMLVAPILSNPYDVFITSGHPHENRTSGQIPTHLSIPLRGKDHRNWRCLYPVVTIHAVGDYTYKVSFQVSDRIHTIGALFCCVDSIDSSGIIRLCTISWGIFQYLRCNEIRSVCFTFH